MPPFRFVASTNFVLIQTSRGIKIYALTSIKAFSSHDAHSQSIPMKCADFFVTQKTDEEDIPHLSRSYGNYN